MLKGILFDLGGTLYSYARLGDATRETLVRLAQEIGGTDPGSLLTHYREANAAADRLYAEQPCYLYRDYFRTIFDDLMHRIGRPELRDHFEWFEEYQRVMLITAMTIKDDCHETLQALSRDGLYLSVVSNADENMLHPLIARARLQQYLQHWTSSEAARSNKPDRRFFEIALQKADLAPDEVLFVGDSLEQDIRGAQSLGLRTVLVSEFEGPAPMHIGGVDVKPDYEIRKLKELLPIVASMRG